MHTTGTVPIPALLHTVFLDVHMSSLCRQPHGADAVSMAHAQQQCTLTSATLMTAV